LSFITFDWKKKLKMKTIYNLVILIFSGLIHVASHFNNKALLWIKGRKDWSKVLEGKINPEDKTIWIHCASLGEFEQGRPVLESIKNKDPGKKIILTFFSPSGFEIRKNYPIADYICYLPADTPGNAARFIELVRPVYVMFVKYEFWNNYISTLYKNNIPLYLISGIFRPEQHFFRWYGGFFRKMLNKFTHIFVQDERSVELLLKIGIRNATVAGDTRFDRVIQIAGTAKDLPVIKKFSGEEKLFLAGSSWRQDEEIIAQYINNFPNTMKWIFAPHEIDRSNIERLEKLFRVRVVRYSEFDDSFSDARVMIIDNLGMLSSAYRYAYIAAIGGGFGKGIHNILEPSCWSIPVLFGPNYGRFKEAVELMSYGGAMCFKDYDEFSTIINKWLSDSEKYKKAADTAGNYVKQMKGATQIIVETISEKRY
jgi:3-deoxy-D-manno-octulosonic-acid transferase